MHIMDKIEAKKAEWKQKHADQHAAKLSKVHHKKHQQRRKGWPSDKSPV
jgi:hypothetical protein